MGLWSFRRSAGVGDFDAIDAAAADFLGGTVNGGMMEFTVRHPRAGHAGVVGDRPVWPVGVCVAEAEVKHVGRWMVD